MAAIPSGENEHSPITSAQRRGDTSVPVPQRLYKQRERGRRLASARVIEVVARIGQTPVFEHPLEATLVDVGLHQALRQITQAETGERRTEHLGRGVEGQLAFDTHLELPRPLFELPGVQSAMG